MSSPRQGTLVVCVQNLDHSGANQVILNLVLGKLHRSNIVVLSPSIGPFAARFLGTGVAVRTGLVSVLLNEIRDIVCVICNTIMTAHIIIEVASR